MSAIAIRDAMRDIVQGAFAAIQPRPNVLGYIPLSFNDVWTVYLYHDGSTDIDKAGPGIIRRTHILPLHVMLLATGDEEQTERDLLTTHDVIANVFYTNRTLNGTAATSQLYQRDGKVSGSSVAYVIDGGKSYRHRYWTLEASEDIGFVFK